MSGYVATDDDFITWPDTAHADIRFGMDWPQAGGIDKYLIAFTLFHHFCIAGHNLHPGLFAGSFDRNQDLPEILHAQAFLQDKAQGEVLGDRATHSQVVHRTVDRQFTDVPTWKKNG